MSDGLKTLIASTPKSGNTWLRHLLMCIYRLPQIEFPYVFDRAAVVDPGGCRIAHQHYSPTGDLIGWAQENGVILLATVRHPADVLISKCHHINGFRWEHIDISWLRQYMREDYETSDVLPGPRSSPFALEVRISIGWTQTGMSHIVRYEELRTETARNLAHRQAKNSGSDRGM